MKRGKSLVAPPEGFTAWLIRRCMVLFLVLEIEKVIEMFLVLEFEKVIEIFLH